MPITFLRNVTVLVLNGHCIQSTKCMLTFMQFSVRHVTPLCGSQNLMERCGGGGGGGGGGEGVTTSNLGTSSPTLTTDIF